MMVEIIMARHSQIKLGVSTGKSVLLPMQFCCESGERAGPMPATAIAALINVLSFLECSFLRWKLPLTRTCLPPFEIASAFAH
jgi:hypothetical protein